MCGGAHRRKNPLQRCPTTERDLHCEKRNRPELLTRTRGDQALWRSVWPTRSNQQRQHCPLAWPGSVCPGGRLVAQERACADIPLFR